MPPTQDNATTLLLKTGAPREPGPDLVLAAAGRIYRARRIHQAAQREMARLSSVPMAYRSETWQPAMDDAVVEYRGARADLLTVLDTDWQYVCGYALGVIEKEDQ